MAFYNSGELNVITPSLRSESESGSRLAPCPAPRKINSDGLSNAPGITQNR